MSSIETTELKLKTTPTGGVDASHSPYYRRLLSAGYKGYLQGTIGGALLYGTMGLAVGGLAALGALPFVGFGIFAFVPLVGAVGALTGATTFGNIGSVAAINAESADLAEQRRYLLDRYYDLPEGPEGDREAAAIKKELMRQHDTGKAPPFMHWKTVVIGAVIGAVVAAAVFSPIGAGLLAHTAMFEVAKDLALAVHLTGLFGEAGAITAVGTSLGVALGTLAGATIGVDRYYIRKWFDHTEGVVHSSSHNETALMERHKQVERIKEANKADEKTKQQLSSSGSDFVQAAPTQETPAQSPVASLDKPSTKISEATLQKRLADIQQAMQIPAL